MDQGNTPTQRMNTSPGQRFLNRRTRTLLQTKETLLRPRVPSPKQQQHKLKQKQGTQAHHYNRNARDFKQLSEGDVVRTKASKPSGRMWKKGLVVQKFDHRSYIVETTEGTRYRRNCYHVRKTQEPPQASKEAEEVDWGMECEELKEDNGLV